MSDASIISSMIDDKLYEYYLEQEEYRVSAEERYYDCLNYVDMELATFYKIVKDVVNEASSKYGLTIDEILNDLVIPSMSAEAHNG